MVGWLARQGDGTRTEHARGRAEPERAARLAEVLPAESAGAGDLDVVASSRVGRDRANNEDAFFVEPGSNLFVVGDGVGGHPAGGRAARLAVQVLAETLREAGALRRPGLDLAQAALALGRAFRIAHQRLVAESERLALDPPAETSVVAALVLDGFAVVANVGDSRAYLIGELGVRRLTTDHTVAETCADIGVIPRSEVARHPFHKVLDRAVGGAHGDQPDLTIVPFVQGECLLLCSNGLWSSVEQTPNPRRRRSDRDLAAMAEDLFERAMKAGSSDDATMVLVERRRVALRRGRPEPSNGRDEPRDAGRRHDRSAAPSTYPAEVAGGAMP